MNLGLDNLHFFLNPMMKTRMALMTYHHEIINLVRFAWIGKRLDRNLVMHEKTNAISFAYGTAIPGPLHSQLSCFLPLCSICFRSDTALPMRMASSLGTIMRMPHPSAGMTAESDRAMKIGCCPLEYRSTPVASMGHPISFAQPRSTAFLIACFRAVFSFVGQMRRKLYITRQASTYNRTICSPSGFTITSRTAILLDRFARACKFPTAILTSRLSHSILRVLFAQAYNIKGVLSILSEDYAENIAKPRLAAVELNVPVDEQRAGQMALFQG